MLLWFQFGGIFDPENSNQKLKELNALAEDPELWNDQVAALKLMKERTYLDQRLSSFNQLELEYKDIIAIIEIAEQDNDEKLLIDAKNQLLNLNKNIKKKELESLLSEEADKNDCFIGVLITVDQFNIVLFICMVHPIIKCKFLGGLGLGRTPHKAEGN